MTASRSIAGAGLCLAFAALPSAATAAGAPLFRDASEETGLAVMHDDGDRGRLELRAIAGPGAALLDYDLDGDLDLYLVTGGPLPGDPAPAGTTRGRLLRNDLAAAGGGAARPRWVDVTAASGLAPEAYGTGIAVGDVDGDGAPDLLLADLDGDRLWRNRGDGRFARDPTALPDGGRWSVTGSFLDLEGDGDLDLYVVRYVAATPGVTCFAESTRRDYCGPAAYPPLPHRLLRNAGGGRFEDVSVASGVAGTPAPGLGSIAVDHDGDGRDDLWVANDGQPNLLWRNRGDGTLADEAPFAGLALSRDGHARAGMGVDAGDADGDGDEDLFVTNLTGETNTLYVALGDGLYADRTAEAGLAAPSLPWTGFGTAFVDADLDGWLDLLVVNGAVRLAHGSAPAAAPGGGAGGEGTGATEAGPAGAEGARAAHLRALGQPGQLYRNLGDGRYAVDAAAGGPLGTPAVARGLAVGDVDGDGRLDAVVAANGGPARLLLGQAGEPAGERPAMSAGTTAGAAGGAAAPHWVGVGPCPGLADAPWLARRVVVERAAPSSAGAPATSPSALHRRPHRDGSYASSRDPRVVAGLGPAGAAAALSLEGGGGRTTWRRPPGGRYLLWCGGTR